MEDLILFGTGPVAQVAEVYLKEEYNIVAHTLDKEYIDLFKKGSAQSDVEILPFDENLKKLNAKIFIPISYTRCNTVREKKYQQAKDWGLKFISYIHPTAKVSGEVGENCMILEDVIIQPYTKLGNNCIAWSHCHIGHHNYIGDHNYITSGSAICGSCQIGNLNFIGAGVLIRDNIDIGNKNIIGMGAVITKSIGDESLYISGVDKKLELRKPIEEIKI